MCACMDGLGDLWLAMRCIIVRNTAVERAVEPGNKVCPVGVLLQGYTGSGGKGSFGCGSSSKQNAGAQLTCGMTQ